MKNIEKNNVTKSVVPVVERPTVKISTPAIEYSGSSMIPCKPVISPPVEIVLKQEDYAKLDALYFEAMNCRNDMEQAQQLLNKCVTKIERANGALEVINRLAGIELQRIDKEYKVPTEKKFLYNSERKALVEVT
jgi:hypothetical protein